MIALLLSMYSFFMIGTRGRTAFIIVVFCGVVLSSKAFSIALGGDLPLTYARIIMPFAFLFFLKRIATAPLTKTSPLLIPFLFLFVCLIFSTFFGPVPQCLIYVADWALVTVLVMVFGAFLAESEGSERRLFKAVLFIAGVLIFTSLVEVVAGVPFVSLLSAIGLADLQALSDRAAEGRVRNELFRAQSFLDNPIRLGQFSAFLSIFLMAMNRGQIPRRWTIILGLTVVVILSGSRSALFILAFGFASKFFVEILFRQLKSLFLFFIILGCMGVVVFAVFLLPLLVQLATDQIAAGGLHLLGTEERSAIARLAQFQWVLSIVTDRPFGFGFLPNAGTNVATLVSLDNYFLRTFLEIGVIPATIFWTWIAILSISYLISGTRRNFFIGIMIVTFLFMSISEYSFEVHGICLFLLSYYYKLTQKAEERARLERAVPTVSTATA
jgi:hypothetical protein